MFSRFDTVPACDRQTDRQTDRRTDRIGISIGISSGISDARKTNDPKLFKLDIGMTLVYPASGMVESLKGQRSRVNNLCSIT